MIGPVFVIVNARLMMHATSCMDGVVTECPEQLEILDNVGGALMVVINRGAALAALQIRRSRRSSDRYNRRRALLVIC